MQKLLPPTLYLLLVVAIAISWWLFRLDTLIDFPFTMLGLVLAVIGLVIASLHSRIFEDEGANIMTFGKPTKLVRRGLFRYSRNPMYLGFAISLGGIAILRGISVDAISLLVSFIVITDRWYIRFEERAMENEFGQAYLDYCQQVRRWL